MMMPEHVSGRGEYSCVQAETWVGSLLVLWDSNGAGHQHVSC